MSLMNARYVSYIYKFNNKKLRYYAKETLCIRP